MWACKNSRVITSKQYHSRKVVAQITMSCLMHMPFGRKTKEPILVWNMLGDFRKINRNG